MISFCGANRFPLVFCTPHRGMILNLFLFTVPLGNKEMGATLTSLKMTIWDIISSKTWIKYCKINFSWCLKHFLTAPKLLGLTSIACTDKSWTSLLQLCTLAEFVKFCKKTKRHLMLQTHWATTLCTTRLVKLTSGLL